MDRGYGLRVQDHQHLFNVDARGHAIPMDSESGFDSQAPGPTQHQPDALSSTPARNPPPTSSSVSSTPVPSTPASASSSKPAKPVFDKNVYVDANKNLKRIDIGSDLFNEMNPFEAMLINRIIGRMALTQHSEENKALALFYGDSKSYFQSERGVKVVFRDCKNVTLRLFEEFAAENAQLMEDVDGNKFCCPPIADVVYYDSFTYNKGVDAGTETFHNALVISFDHMRYGVVNSYMYISNDVKEECFRCLRAREKKTSMHNLTADLSPALKQKVEGNMSSVGHFSAGDRDDDFAIVYRYLLSACVKFLEGVEFFVTDNSHAGITVRVKTSSTSFGMDLTSCIARIKDMFRQSCVITMRVETAETEVVVPKISMSAYSSGKKSVKIESKFFLSISVKKIGLGVPQRAGHFSVPVSQRTGYYTAAQNYVEATRVFPERGGRLSDSPRFDPYPRVGGGRLARTWSSAEDRYDDRPRKRRGYDDDDR